MKRAKSILALLIPSLLFSACFKKTDNCSVRKFNYREENYETRGCIVDSLESGEWQFYNITNSTKLLTEIGVFDRGIRVGEWHYPKNKSDSTITWERYLKRDLNLLFNIPSLMKVVEDSSDYIKFSNNDSNSLFNIVLSLQDINSFEAGIDSFFKKGEEEIKAKGWKFTCERNIISTSKRIFYFNEYKINTNAVSDFKVLNIYGLMKNNKLFQITCRYAEIFDATARTIFFSILTNSFYYGERFLNPFNP